MNGPTRPRQFDKGRAVRGNDRPASADIFDELDQFVDSEPARWSARTAAARRGHAEDAADSQDADQGSMGDREDRRSDFARALSRVAIFDDADQNFAKRSDRPSRDEGAPDPAFGKAPTSARRAAFTARLTEEMDKPPEPKRTAPATAAAPAAPEFAQEAGAAASAKDSAAPKPIPAGQAVARPAPSIAANDAASAAPSGVGANTDAGGTLIEDDPVMRAQEDAPADALQWELDNAIGAIVASAQSPSGAEPDDAAAGAAAGRADGAGMGAGEAVRHELSSDAEEDVRPVGSPRRLKPIPTFRFDRRQEDEAAPRVLDDPEDPLSSIFLSELSDDRAREEGRARDDDDLLSDLMDEPQDAAFDGYDDDADVDRLPPSLSRAARTGSRGRRVPVAIAAGMGGLAVLAVSAVIGINVIAGNGGESAPPPVIRADAADVKVRPDEEAQTAEPDIIERARIDETAPLVMPDTVSLQGESERVEEVPAEGAAADATEGLISRRVRTVVVRPDGTIVRAGEVDASAATARVRQEEPEQRIARVEPQRPAQAEPAFPTREVAEPEPQAAPAPPAEERFAFAPADGSADVDAAVAQDAQPIEDAFGPVEGPAPDAAIPRPRPNPPPRRTASAGPVDLAAQRQEVTRTAQPAPVQTANAAWGVQVSSQRSRSEAERAFRGLQERYPSILGSRQPMIIAADLGDRGRFYRVRLGAPSRGEAASLCQRLKSAGADCFISRN